MSVNKRKRFANDIPELVPGRRAPKLTNVDPVHIVSGIGVGSVISNKLNRLEESLYDDEFPQDIINEWITQLRPVYFRWLNPVNINDLNQRIKENQGLCDTRGDGSVVIQSLQTMDEDAEIIRKLLQSFHTHPNYTADTDTDLMLKSISNNTLQVIWFTRMHLFSYLRIVKLSSADVLSFNEETNKDCRDGIYWYDLKLQDKEIANDKKQRLISHLLFHFSLRGFRKVQEDADNVYTQKTITTEQGLKVNTYTWEQHCTLRQAIFELCRKEEHSELWNIVISEREVINAENYLKECIDQEFPYVQRQRRKYSFRDGIYDGDKDVFTTYASGVLTTFPELDVYGTFMFIDQIFLPAYAVDPSLLRCPNFDSIMYMQKWSQDCITMMYVMIGRLMHAVAEKDNWQIMPYLVGEAGAGKSTIIDTIQKLVPRHLIGVFGSGGESQFGTQDWDKLALLVFPEIKPNEFIKSMPLGRWFQLIAGDAVCLPAKFKAPKYVTHFPVHIIAAGNECPSWGDDNGAWTRRTACFPFRRKILDRNPDLPSLINSELPIILRRSLVAYNKAVKEYAGKDLWSKGTNGKPIMPKEIREESQRIQSATNPMVDFLLDREFVEIDQNTEVSRADFINAFEMFMRSVRHQCASRWCIDLYGHAFQLFGLSIESSNDGDIIKGCRVKKSN